MCLYPKLIINRKYTPTKKNGGVPPICNDERVKYVAIGCGNCIECRKQKAREWQVRLNEEIKHKRAYFVTLTFSNEQLERLCKQFKQIEGNSIAAIAVRHFLERWRKKHKVSLRHWLITELGHENTERIHLHGLIFSGSLGGAPLASSPYGSNTRDWDTSLNSVSDITNYLQGVWQYGMVYVGDYCNAKTINYIIKYVTKIDTQHKNYKQIILCSSGLGGKYTETEAAERNRYRPRETREFYRMPNGYKCNLPIYYRNKIYSEQEREALWIEKLDAQEIYVLGNKYDISNEQGIRNYNAALKEAQKRNEQLGWGSDAKEWQAQKYNVTLRMLQKAKKLEAYQRGQT